MSPEQKQRIEAIVTQLLAGNWQYANANAITPEIITNLVAAATSIVLAVDAIA